MIAVNIQQAAKRIGVSSRMLRHYESEGLITPTRSKNGYRTFSDQEIQQAAWIRDLIGSGFSTRELRKIVSDFDNNPLNREPNCSIIMREKLEQIDRLIATLQDRRSALSLRLAAWEHEADG
jgi:MerR family copper efflux transcriptional regulator